MEQQVIDKEALNGSFAGTIVTPGEEAWDSARQAWNLAVTQEPAAVVYVETPDDVSAAIDFARRNGFKIAAQGSGHGAAPRSSLDSSILLRTDRMKGIEVDPENRVGRYEAGVLWMEANPVAGEHGLANLSGSAADVGIAGYTTGGGFGWLARKYGLACNSVRAIELVTADGEQRRIDRDTEPDLFWAVRGGGGSFAVATAIEYELIDLPEVFAGSVLYPADDGTAGIVHSYFDWAGGLPDEVNSIVRFLHLPPLPQIPEPLQDTPLVTITACHAGPESDGAELIAPMRELGEPVMDTFQSMSPADLGTIHMEPQEPVPGLVHTTSLREAPAEAIDAWIEAAGPESGSPLLGCELRQCGGAAGRPADGSGARSHIDAAFLLVAVGTPMTPDLGKAIEERLDTIVGALGPWSTGGSYFNFAERPTPSEQLFDAATLERLRDVKRRYDPDGVICGNHNITAA